MECEGETGIVSPFQGLGGGHCQALAGGSPYPKMNTLLCACERNNEPDVNISAC